MNPEIYFPKFAREDQLKYRNNNELYDKKSENNKNFGEIFDMFDEELKSSGTPHEAILNVIYKLKKKINGKNKWFNFY